MHTLNNVEIIDTCPSPSPANLTHAHSALVLNACVNVKWVTFLMKNLCVEQQAACQGLLLQPFHPQPGISLRPDLKTFLGCARNLTTWTR